MFKNRADAGTRKGIFISINFGNKTRNLMREQYNFKFGSIAEKAIL